MLHFIKESNFVSDTSLLSPNWKNYKNGKEMWKIVLFCLTFTFFHLCVSFSVFIQESMLWGIYFLCWLTPLETWLYANTLEWQLWSFHVHSWALCRAGWMPDTWCHPQTDRLAATAHAELFRLFLCYNFRMTLWWFSQVFIWGSW